MKFKSNTVIKYSALTIMLMFTKLVLSQSTPNKAYKFLISTRYSGDDVLAQNTEIEISENGTISWNSPVYFGSIPLSTDIDAFSKKFDVITINFNIRGNIYGHKGKLIINLTKKQLGFSEPSIDYNSRQRTGFYDFEILETDQEKNERYRTEDKKLYSSIDQAIANNEYLKAKMFVDKLNYPNSFEKINEFRMLEKKYKLSKDLNEYNAISKLIEQGEIHESNKKINNLTLPFEYSKIDAFDLLVIDSINNFLDNNKFEQATKIYEYLKKSENKKNQKVLIQNKLEIYFENKTEKITLNYLSDIIEKKKIAFIFNNVRTGKYLVKIDKKGNLNIFDSLNKIITRGEFGMLLSDITQRLKEKNNLPSLKGVYVAEVTEGGAADKTGIKKGDVILKAGTKDVNSYTELANELDKIKLGDKINLTVRDSKGSEMNHEVKVDGTITNPIEKRIGNFTTKINGEINLDVTENFEKKEPKYYFTKNQDSYIYGKLFKSIKNGKIYSMPMVNNVNNNKYTHIEPVQSYPKEFPKNTLRTIQPTTRILTLNDSFKIEVRNENKLTFYKSSDEGYLSIEYRNSDVLDEKIKTHLTTHGVKIGLPILLGSYLGILGYNSYKKEQEEKNNL